LPSLCDAAVRNAERCAIFDVAGNKSEFEDDMLTNFISKRWRLGIIAAVLGSVMLVFATGGASYAEQGGQIGETTNWNPDNIDYGDQELQTAGTVSEARNAGNLMQIWRSNDSSGNMWVDVNDGRAISLPGSTPYNPVIVPYGGSGFAIFHRGTDGQIYMATISNLGIDSFTWTTWRGTGLFSAYGPSVTQLGDASTQLYMVFTSNFNQSVLGSFYNGSNWSVLDPMGGVTFSAPSITFDPQNHRIWAAHVGTDSHVYIQWQALGSSFWNGWYQVGGTVVGPVGFAATTTGNMQLAARDPDGFLWFQEIDSGGSAHGWTQDLNHWRSRWPIFLSQAGAVLYALLSGYNDNNRVYYKQSFTG
jgi:hypothetical protein